MKDKKTVWNIRNSVRLLLGAGIFGIGLSLFSFDSLAVEGKADSAGTVTEIQLVSAISDPASLEESVELATANTDQPAGEVEAMPNQNANVTGGDVNVRSAASTATDNKIAKAPNGTAMVVSGKTTGSDGKIWYQVTLTVDGNEITGFIRSDYVALGDVIPEPEPEPVPEPQPEPEPAPETPQAESKPYDTVQETKEDGTTEWYLYDMNDADSTKWLKYPIPKLLEAAKEYETLGTQVGQQKIIIIVMVVVIVILVLGITLLIFKVKDSSMDDDDDDDDADYEDTPPVRRKRPVNEERTVARRPSQGEGRPVRRPVQDGERPVRRPSQEGQPRPKQSGRPAQRPAGEPQRRQAPQGTRQRPSAPRPQEREVVYEEEPGMDKRRDQNGAWRSKNFLSEDDEFEFEFLNMDDPNKL